MKGKSNTHNTVQTIDRYKNTYTYEYKNNIHIQYSTA